jgi:hypothetical protein
MTQPWQKISGKSSGKRDYDAGIKKAGEDLFTGKGEDLLCT